MTPKASGDQTVLFALDDMVPELGEGAWVAPTAVLIGNIRLGARASVWFGAVLRGDEERLEIGPETNIQDGCVCHADPGFPLIVGEGCTIGHKALLHGCTIGDRSLVGMSATILNGAVIGANCIIGAGALIPENKVIPPNSVVIGSPGRVVRELRSDELHDLRAAAADYVSNSRHYASNMRRI